MYVVDASVWVSRFVKQDVHHEASEKWLGELILRDEPLIAPGILLPEVAGALARRTGDSELARRVVASIVKLPALRVIDIDRNLARLAATLAADLRLRGADALYVATAYRLRIPLITWDVEQKERSAHLINALTPEEAASSI